MAIEHGCTIVSTDADFDRFAGLRWSHPLRRYTKDGRYAPALTAIQATR